MAKIIPQLLAAYQEDPEFMNYFGNTAQQGESIEDFLLREKLVSMDGKGDSGTFPGETADMDELNYNQMADEAAEANNFNDYPEGRGYEPMNTADDYTPLQTGRRPMGALDGKGDSGTFPGETADMDELNYNQMADEAAEANNFNDYPEEQGSEPMSTADDYTPLQTGRRPTSFGPTGSQPQPQPQPQRSNVPRQQQGGRFSGGGLKRTLQGVGKAAMRLPEVARSVLPAMVGTQRAAEAAAGRGGPNIFSNPIVDNTAGVAQGIGEDLLGVGNNQKGKARAQKITDGLYNFRSKF